MEMTWTSEQQKVISLHNRNLLVSAAAGSGKTAVLVERIIQMILNKEHPMDIDRLLVVTFTNAAAAEMRERIGNAIEKALRQEPDNTHLQSQMTLLHNAQISTIHSFGLSVIRNHFYEIDLDPGFRIGDEREISMLKEDVLKKVMEDAYEKEDGAFIDLIRAYGNVKNDDNICRMVLSLYEYADSYPWPVQWLERCLFMYQCETEDEFEEQPWMQELISYLKDVIHDMEVKSDQMKSLVLQEDGPVLYLDAIEADLELLRSLKACDRYEDWYRLLHQMKFQALSRKKQSCDADKKERVKNQRNGMKKQLTQIRDVYFSYTIEEQLQMLIQERPAMEALIALTKEFMTQFAAAKADKNLIDFADIEHFTLKILVDEETGLPTPVAREYQEQFTEVMVDEYQDSNYVQEALLTAVSRQSAGENNMFMVGDVKQSIYRFRLARPELFMDKYNRYTLEESKNQRIDLHNNFRSRPQVLQFTNDIFYHIMDRDMGNIVYDSAAALYPGASFEETENEEVFCPEILLVNKDLSDHEDRVETEARAAAARIRELTNPAVAGKGSFAYRDIVILVHALKGWSEIFTKVFSQEGIPLITSSKTGYFSAIEVQTMIQMLRILNNPRQDIALAGVMRSAIGGFSASQLAQIKAAFPEHSFYEAVRCMEQPEKRSAGKLLIRNRVITEGEWDQLCQKVTEFWALIRGFRERIPDTPVHEMIQAIYQETGYLDYVTALPGGDRRRANLEMFLELSISYENTSYQGLFDFIRYIEQMLKYELDYGEAELVSDQENAVRLMTIHKSKGLEFPVVMLCGMGKEFNLMSLNEPLVFHPQYGAGLRWMDVERGVKRTFLPRQVFGLLEKRELLGEELRLLYVALTRAKEKLILTGIVDEKKEYGGSRLETEEKLSFAERMNARCFYDWVMPVVQRSDIACLVKELSAESYQEQKKDEFLTVAESRRKLLLELEQRDESIYEELDRQMQWKYPYEGSGKLKQKVSVSELKHRFMEQQNLEDAVFLHKEPEVIPYVPRFADREEEENAGALRGTAMHRFLECVDFEALNDIFTGMPDNAAEQSDRIEAFVSEQLQQMSVCGRISEDLKKRLSIRKLCQFLSGDTAKRMSEAAKRGDLYRERPFMMSVPAGQIWSEASNDEPVLVQGIVDVFWMEEDGITLLDYKTDAVSFPEELVTRYELQLQLYAQALSKVFDNCKIKDILIYSFKFQQNISVKGGTYERISM